MQPLRILILRRPASFAALLMAALLVRLLVPAGYMPAAGSVALRLCPGATPAIAMPHGDHGRGERGEHPAGGQPCAFAGLGLTALGAVDLAVALSAIGFMLLLLQGRHAATAFPARPRLRPPLRAPPLPA